MFVAMTGGDGAVGRALQKILAQRSVAFRSLVSSEPPMEFAEMGEHLVGEETDSDKAADLLEGADVLVHLGRTAIAFSDEFCQDELAGQATLIPAAHARGAQIHYLSTSEVFTPSDDPADDPIDEGAPTEPSSPLGVAKLAWEQTLRIWDEHRQLQYVIYRVPTVIPEYLTYSHPCARYLRAGFQTREIVPRAHEGDRWGLSFVHAEDLARVIADTLGRTDVFGEVFHVAADQWVPEHALAEMSHSVLNDFMIPSKWEPPAGEIPTGLVGEVYLDSAKARRVLNLNTANSVPRLATKMRLWIDDFGSTARMPLAQ